MSDPSDFSDEGAIPNHQIQLVSVLYNSMNLEMRPCGLGKSGERIKAS